MLRAPSEQSLDDGSGWPCRQAIPGTGSLAHLEENMAARSITLTPDDLADLA
jgi:aryl-alcohol dehydrogenase-like predicted oxidoreductase